MPDPFEWESIELRGWSVPRLWREFSDETYRNLLNRWLPRQKNDRALKTDLFDEAFGSGLVAELGRYSREVHALDISGKMVQRARAEHPALVARVLDVRKLEYPSETFDLVVSNSTLDHFESAVELNEALSELYRVTKPGGLCIVSLDNLLNPVIRLRQALPFPILHGLGLVPYYVGHTLTPVELERALVRAGFKVKARTALMHVPRLPAVWLCRLLEILRLSRLRRPIIRFFHLFERLEKLPTRDFTGYFSVCLAQR